MQMCKVSAGVILLLCLQLYGTQCLRITMGGGRTSGGGRLTRPYSPAVHRSPSVYHSPAVHRQTVASHQSSHGSGTARPLGFDPAVPPPKQNNPLHSAPPQGTGTGTVRPLGFDPPGHSPGSSHHPVGPPKQNSPLGNAPPYAPAGYHGQNPPPYNPHYNGGGFGQPPAYNPAGHPQTHNPAGYGPPPAYNQGNYHPQAGYQPQGGYQPGYHPQGGGGGGGVTIINNNVNNHHGGYGGYAGYSPPVYTSHDTGSTALGFFLGYSLAKISTPSYQYHGNYYDSGSGPRYDHYSIHHYYHNKENLPKEATIEPNAIVACVGDSGSFCPANTTSLCTNNGAVMCVASAVSTVPCTKEKQTNCVKSTVPCKDNNAPECKQSAQSSATISIPCISTAKIYGDISYVNNSIVVSNSTNLSNTSATDGNPTANATATEASTIVTTTESNTNITTTTAAPVNAAANKTQGPAQTFCVTILALPAEKKLTEGEKLLKSSKEKFAKFAVNALGIE